MHFSIRRYYGFTFAEIFLGFLIAVLVGLLIGHVVITSQFSLLSIDRKTLWWDFSWIRKKSPWGFLITFLMASSSIMAILQVLWILFQWLATCFVSRKMAVYDKLDNSLPQAFIKGLDILFHPFRRIACLITNHNTSTAHLPSIIIFEQRQRFLSENDKVVASFPWKMIKFFTGMAILGSWFLSLFVFYSYATTIVSGQSAVNNLWVYFSSSFRIFVHTLFTGFGVIMLGLIANRFANLYLLHLNNVVYDEVLPRIDVEGRNFGEIKDALLLLNEKIDRIEQIVGNLVKMSLTNR